MGDNNISEKLKELATGENRSATARIREIFEEIEVTLRSGARRKDVHQALKESGIAITFESFELAIYRIRKEIGKQKKHTAPKKNSTACVGVPYPPHDPPPTRTGFHQVIEQIAEQNSSEDPRREF
jgi:hypothetical protein